MPARSLWSWQRGAVLVVLSPTVETKVGSAVFIGSALLLFGVSAIYHLGTWPPAVWALLRRLDHSNIFILIAGTYTAFAMLLLHGTARTYLLVGIWGGAVLGVLFRVFWTGAPRWLYTPIYIVLGWFAVFFIPDFIDGAHFLSPSDAVATLGLVVVGGLLYTLGGVVYGLKKPNPKPGVVRLPRGLPRPDDPGVPRPLRRRLDRDLRPALSTSRRPRAREPRSARGPWAWLRGVSAGSGTSGQSASWPTGCRGPRCRRRG